MAVLTYPGVYVEEVPSGVRPLEGAGTSTAAFFGVAEKGTIDNPQKIFNVTEFRRNYGGFLADQYLAHSVFQFFNNGGTQCYITRLASGAIAASIAINDRRSPAQAKTAITITTVSKGTWSNKLKVKIKSTTSQDTAKVFDIDVFEENLNPNESPIILEAFKDLSIDPG